MTTIAKADVAESFVSVAEDAAREEGRGFIKYPNTYYIKVRRDGEGYVYATSLGHVYESREACLEDVKAAVGQRDLVGCGICKRIRPGKDYRATYCEACVADIKAKQPTPQEAAEHWAALTPQAPIRRVNERLFEVASRTRAGSVHQVAWALDGALICNCEAASLGGRECWAIKAVREELEMTTEVRNEMALTPVQLTPPTALLPTERTYALIDKAAQLAFTGAIALPKELNTPQKVGAVMLYGYELGIKPMTAIQELYIVNGRVQPSARIMAGLLAARTDARLSVVESTDKKCTMRLVWPSRHVDATWTVEWSEIERAKLANRDVWATYPRDKLITHCTKRILRVYAPDIINGLVGPVVVDGPVEDEPEDDSDLYNPGETAYIDGEGRVVDADTGEITREAPQESQQPSAQTASPLSPAEASPDAPRATEADMSAVLDWEAKVKDARGGPALNACKSWMAHSFDYAKGQAKNLYDVDVATYIDVLRSCAETGSMPALQGAFT